jgi:hypothetical protein
VCHLSLKLLLSLRILRTTIDRNSATSGGSSQICTCEHCDECLRACRCKLNGRGFFVAGAGRVQEHERTDGRRRSEEIVIDEAYFLKPAVLNVGQGLRHGLIVGELVHRDVYFRLR